MNLQNELYRKIIHFLLILVPILFSTLGKWPSLLIFGAVSAFVISLDYLRNDHPKIQNLFVKIFRPILRDHELDGKKLCGASWVGLATCINFLFFREEIAVTAFTILVISDGLAALVGKSIPSQAFFEKSLSGAAAFFISGFIVILICGGIFHCRFWFYLIGLFALFCVTIIESRPSLFKIDDNFTIPIGFSLIMTFFDIVWNYNY